MCLSARVFSDICFWPLLEAVTGSVGMTQYWGGGLRATGGEQVAAELPKEAVSRGQEMGRKQVFMERYWNIKKSGLSSCMEVQAFSDTERIVF